MCLPEAYFDVSMKVSGSKDGSLSAYFVPSQPEHDAQYALIAGTNGSSAVRTDSIADASLTSPRMLSSQSLLQQSNADAELEDDLPQWDSIKIEVSPRCSMTSMRLGFR